MEHFVSKTNTDTKQQLDILCLLRRCNPSTKAISRACHSAIASPTASTVLIHDCLGRPILRLLMTGGPKKWAWTAQWWSCRSVHLSVGR